MSAMLVQEITNRLDYSPADLRRAGDFSALNFLQKNFDTYSEIRHPFFERSFRRTQEVKDRIRLDLQKERKEIYDQVVALQKWAGRTDRSGMSYYDDLIDPKTHMLYYKTTREFVNQRNEAFANKDGKWLSKYYELKPDSGKVYEKVLSNFMANRGITEESMSNNAFDASRVRNFVDNFSPGKALLDRRSFWLYYKLKDEYADPVRAEGKSITSSEYMKIHNTPALKKFYDFYLDKMGQYREMMGLGSDYDTMPSNFVPYLRRSAAESLFKDGMFHSLFEDVKGSFKLMPDDQEFGDIYTGKRVNLENGEVMHDIPRWMLNPIRNAKGDIDHSLRTFDLGKLLYLMSDSARHYEGLKNLQGEMDANTFLLSLPEVGAKQGYGKKEMKVRGGDFIHESGENSKLLDLYRTFVNYTIYGVKTQDPTLNPNTIRTVHTLNEIGRTVMLGANPVLQLGTMILTKTNQYFEGNKGFLFTKLVFCLIS